MRKAPMLNLAPKIQWWGIFCFGGLHTWVRMEMMRLTLSPKCAAMTPLSPPNWKAIEA